MVNGYECTLISSYIDHKTEPNNLDKMKESVTGYHSQVIFKRVNKTSI